MELTPRLRLMNWLVRQGLTGLPENDLLRGFCERCRAAGMPLSRAIVFIDTLHPIFEGRGFRWNDGESNEADIFEYGSTSTGEASQTWRRSAFYHMLENGHDEIVIDLADTSHDFSMIGELAEKGHKHFAAFVHRFGEAGTIGEMDCFYSYYTTRHSDGFDENHMAALRDLVPVLGLAIKSAAQVEIARTLGRVYLGRDTAEQVLRGRMQRGITEKIKAVLWYSDVRGSTAISERIGPDEIIPFLNDYAQASIDAIHDAGGEVLKLIGDGVLAMFTGENVAGAKRAALRAEHRFRHNIRVLNDRRENEGRPTTTAYVGLHVGQVFYGNIGSEDRLDFTVVGPAVNEVSRIASMCASVDRELLTSTDFRTGLDAAGRNYLVSTGRFALRGIGHAQDLYTLDPAVAADEVVGGKYERYLAS
ncbi:MULTISPECIES: adenylate/guanylate cyclase domain-containing protein [Bradyrhizobium]|jgi:adenylate cyclase|uniref:adenylate/guanylate cyclase domain-containing protein n=1 Tax=Bradyrhizobium TaxID=374 RepID=UPI00047F32C4|nr:MULTISPECIES: adenylate/guanylate cyclase domain-containing protein [Bradyrhizobium]MDI2055887.1 adenylate/guanylate cyclase domain-containing protein [Bradyrhizobium sp. Mp19]MDI2103875.1 adenylate/guanylate cyclase domain-containing protein [Bradyrhizobium sp. Mp64]WLA96573.1 adenylate/guanylate cyclase domain-containing protein [Bradyrhizobium elkanii]WLC11753.1 adenylate/guanylate cyclase domain-containing protein [Bradyrhizobium elkanii USDA 94]